MPKRVPRAWSSYMLVNEASLRDVLALTFGAECDLSHTMNALLPAKAAQTPSDTLSAVFKATVPSRVCARDWRGRAQAADYETVAFFGTLLSFVFSRNR